MWEGSLDSSAGFRPVRFAVSQGRPHAQRSGRWQRHPWCALRLASLQLGRAHLRRPSLNVTFSLGRSLRKKSHSLLCAYSLSSISHLLVHIIDYSVQSWLSSEAVTFLRAETVIPVPLYLQDSAQFLAHQGMPDELCVCGGGVLTRYLKY